MISFYFFIFYRSVSNVVADLGFGSVFDGSSDGGQMRNLSTQAVMDYIKNANVGSEFDVIEIGSEEAAEFFIPQNVDGKFCFCVKLFLMLLKRNLGSFK